MSANHKYDTPEEIEELLFPDNHPIAHDINSAIREAYEIGRRRRTQDAKKSDGD